MPEGEDDIREWLRENASQNPLEQLRQFRAQNPDDPIPDKLEFAALVAPLFGEEGERISYDEELANQIDGILAEADRAVGGGQISDARRDIYQKLDVALEAGNSFSQALKSIEDELPDMDLENVKRGYQRYAHKHLVDEIGEAICDGGEPRGTELLDKLRRRFNTFGWRWPD